MHVCRLAKFVAAAFEQNVMSKLFPPFLSALICQKKIYIKANFFIQKKFKILILDLCSRLPPCLDKSAMLKKKPQNFHTLRRASIAVLCLLCHSSK